MKKREQIPNEYKWDLSSYYSSEKDYENDYNFVENNYKKLSDFQNKLNNKNDILNCFELDEKISRKLEKLYVFASLETKQDMTNQNAQKRLKKLEKLSL